MKILLNPDVLENVIGGVSCPVISNNTLQQGPWGKAWGEGGWGSGNPNSASLEQGPWGKAWGEGGWGSGNPNSASLEQGPWGKAWGEGGWGSSRK